MARRSKISDAGLRRIGRVRRMAIEGSDTQTALDVGQVREWVNALLAAASLESMSVPDSVTDSQTLRNRMDVVLQHIASQVREENADRGGILDDAAAAAEHMFSQRQRGKSRHLTTGKMTNTKIREAALRSVGLLRKG